MDFKIQAPFEPAGDQPQAIEMCIRDRLDALGGEKALSWLYLHEHANSLNPAMTKLALLFIVIGYGTKAGMAPMHRCV